MKALVYTGPQALSFQDVAQPLHGAQGTVVRTHCVGICGSDMHAYLGHDERRPAPLILGHEAAGIVESGPLAGDRVTVNPLVTCGSCPACVSGKDNLCPDRQIISMPPREGAFAERFLIPENNMVVVPDDVPLEKAALAEPIACGWHAVRLGLDALNQQVDGASALVIGGGAIGLGAALASAAQGIGDITMVEPNALRRGYLERRCGQRVVEPENVETGFDLVVDAVGYAVTRAQASACVRPGGVITHIGLGQAEGGLDIRRMTLQEITFIGTYTYTAEDFRQTARAIFENRLGPLDWTETRSLSDGAQAFNDIRNGSVEAPKILLTPN